MRNHLVVHDVFPYLYMGMSENLKKFSQYSIEGMKVGGIKMFLHKMCEDLVDDSDVLYCFDAGPSFRKNLLASYKNGRKLDPNIIAQADFLYEFLMRLGVPCYREKDYEADDLIYSAVEHLRKEYRQVTVAGSDYDLTHNVIPGVSFRGVSSLVNSCSVMNFQHSVSPTHKVLLNTISAYKVFTGCNSDKIPAVASSISGIKLYDLFCDTIWSSVPEGQVLNVEEVRKKEVLLSFLDRIEPALGKDVIDAYRKNASIVFPREYKDDYVGISLQSLPQDSKNTIARLSNTVREFTLSKRLGALTTTELTSPERQKFREISRALSTGEYLADNGLSLEISSHSFNELDLGVL